MYFAKKEYNRRNYNSQGLTLTGLNAADATAKILDHARNLNIDEKYPYFKTN